MFAWEPEAKCSQHGSCSVDHFFPEPHRNPPSEMSAVAEFQARARAQAIHATSSTPETTLNDTPGPPENKGTDDERNDTIVPQHEDPPPDNSARPDNLTVDIVTRLIRRHNLPEGVSSEVRDFQRVFSWPPLKHHGNSLNI